MNSVAWAEIVVTGRCHFHSYFAVSHLHANLVKQEGVQGFGGSKREPLSRKL